jgi:hypothetical protein
VAVLDGLGAAPVAALTRRRLRTAAVLQVPRSQDRDADRPGRADRSPAGDLALVADGLTKAEIAARLVLSVREDDHHASAVLTKLGMTTRRKAAGGRRRSSPPS